MNPLHTISPQLEFNLDFFFVVWNEFVCLHFDSEDDGFGDLVIIEFEFFSRAQIRIRIQGIFRVSGGLSFSFVVHK